MERLSDILQTFYINITAGTLPIFSGCLSSFKIIPADSQYFEKIIFAKTCMPAGGYSHIVWVGVCHWVCESPTLY